MSTQPLIAMVQTSKADITSLLKVLPSKPEQLESLNEYFDTFQMLAQEQDNESLMSLCSLFYAYVDGLSQINHVPKMFRMLVLSCLNAIESFKDDESEDAILECINNLNLGFEQLMPLMEQHSVDDELTALIDESELPDSSVIENINLEQLDQAIDNAASEFANDELDDAAIALMLGEDELNDEAPKSVIDVLTDELTDLQLSLTNLYQQLISSPEGLERYIERLSRFHQASEDLEFEGLSYIANFLLENVVLISQQEDLASGKYEIVLTIWPNAIINHLNHPNDDQLCIDLLDFLEQDSWPQPLPYQAVRPLLEGLTGDLEKHALVEAQSRQHTAKPEDIELNIDKDASNNLIDAFFAEVPDQVQQFSQLINQIQSSGLQALQACQRITHTLKGSANLIGVKGIANVTHHLEDIFEYLAKHQLTVNDSLAAMFVEASDLVEMMLEHLQKSGPKPNDALSVLQAILDWANLLDSGEYQADSLVELSTNQQPEDVQPTLEEETFSRVSTDLLKSLFDLTGESAIGLNQIKQQMSNLEQHQRHLQNLQSQLQIRRRDLENQVSLRQITMQQDASSQEFDSLELDQYDDLYQATHGYIEAVSDSQESVKLLNKGFFELSTLLQNNNQINRELQQAVLSTRLEKIESIASRLKRAVRQAAKATEKSVDLEIIGDNLAVDEEVLAKITAPIMHLLRNAVDHGIEAHDIRLEKEKAPTGNIQLAFKKTGNFIEINCVDDGNGLNFEKIRQQAIAQNLAKKSDDLSEDQISQFILHPGFSTKDETTHISGRGVGLDVVNATVMDLKGQLSITNNEQAGSTFSLKIPLTMLTTHSTMVEVNGADYALPSTSLEQIINASQGTIIEKDGNHWFQYEDAMFKVFSLAALLGEASYHNMKSSTFLLTHDGASKVAVAVDATKASLNLVIKPLGKFVPPIKGIEGTTMLGNGELVNVLNLQQLLLTDNYLYQQAKSQHTQVAKVLIADDSLSVRNSLAQLVTDAGFEPVLAHDGVEALTLAKQIKPNLLLTDLEMPRMTGLELTQHIRALEEFNDLPITMITSRTVDKHKQSAMNLGVNEYVSKPYKEEDLQSLIMRQLQ